MTAAGARLLLVVTLLGAPGAAARLEARPRLPAAPVISSAQAPDSTLIATLRQSLNSLRWPAAESLATILRARAEARAPVDTLLLARALDQFVAARIGAGRTNDAALRGTAERAVRLRERALGPDDPDLAISLIRLAQLLNAQGDCAAARPPAERGVAIRERVLGPDHIMVARGLTILGMVQTDCGDYPAAVATFERTVAIREKALGPDDAEVAVSLNNLGATLADLGQIDGAERAYRRALTIREKTLGPDHPYVATTLGNLANMATLRGDYTLSRTLNERALAIREKTLGADHAETAMSYNNLGILYYYLGDFEAARQWDEKGLRAREAALGPDHPDLAMSAANLGTLLVRMGDYAGALQLFERSLGIYRRSGGGSPVDEAYTISAMASALGETGELDRALRLAAESVRVARRDLGTQSPLTAGFMESQAWVLGQAEQLPAARLLLRRVLTIRERSLGATTPDVARTCVLLADIERRLGHLRVARQLSDRAAAIYRATPDTGQPGRDEALGDRALLFFQSGEGDSALAPALEAERMSREQLRLTAQTLPERQALRFAAARASTRDLLLTLAGADTSGGRARPVWDAVMAARGLVLDEMATRLRVAHLRTDDRTDSLRAGLADASAWLAHLLTGEESTTPTAARAARLEAARVRREEAERALAAGSALYRRQQLQPDPTVTALAAARPAGTALVAFCRYAEVPRRAPAPLPGLARYLAFVLPADSDEPRVVPLGAADSIDALVDLWRDELGHGALRTGRSEPEALMACDAAGAAVRRAVWDPLLPRLGAARRVFITPEGPLHLVNFGALPLDSGGYLVETDRVLHVLTTERDLLVDDSSAPLVNGLLAFGGAAFDSTGLPADEPIPSTRMVSRPGTAPGAAIESASFRGTPNDCPRFRDLRFTPLPGSLEELDDVMNAWATAPAGRAGGPALHVTGRQASEETLKRLAAGRRVLHLATHGFYLGAECGEGPAASRGIGGLVPAAVGGAAPSSRTTPPGDARPAVRARRPDRIPEDLNPFRLSGVALAGANLREAATGAREDGILTAEELALLNLDGLEWAVLSACNSGVGAVGEGEGVFGLRRALQIAGARTVILALWDVRDDVTVAWMKALYEAHFDRGLDTAESLQAASRELLAGRRAAGLSVHPFYWAGFLAAGGWR